MALAVLQGRIDAIRYRLSGAQVQVGIQNFVTRLVLAHQLHLASRIEQNARHGVGIATQLGSRNRINIIHEGIERFGDANHAALVLRKPQAAVAVNKHPRQEIGSKQSSAIIRPVMFQYSLFHIIDKGAVAIGGNNKTVVSLCTDIVFAEAVVQSLFFAQQVDVAIDAQRREDYHVAILGRYEIGALDGFQESRTARHLKIGRAGHLHRPEVDGIGYTLHKENPLVVPSHRRRRLVQ